MKLLIAGGNMATNNVLQIRIMPPSVQNAQTQANRPHLILAAYGQSTLSDLPAEIGYKLYTLQNLIEGMLGYSQGRGAQALGQVPVVLVHPPSPPTATGPEEPSAPPEPFSPAPYNPPPSTGATQPPSAQPEPPSQPPTTPPTSGPPTQPGGTTPPPPSSPVVSPTNPVTPCPIGKATEIVGTVTVIRNGAMISLKVGDPICAGDTIQTGANSSVTFLLADNTQWMLAPNTTASASVFVFDPKKPAAGSSTLNLLSGAFRYISGLIEKNNPKGANIETPVGSIGIRGTEFIGKYDAVATTLEIDLISGAVALTPAGGSAGPTMSAPIQIEDGPSGMQALPLTQTQYNTIESQNFPGVPIS